MKILDKINLYKNKYELSLYSSSTSFYMFITIFSLLVLIIQFYNYFANNDLILNSIIESLNDYYIEYFEEIVPIFSLKSLSPFLFINLIWSSSKYINGFNKISDAMYCQNKRRNLILNRISSILILLLIIFVLSLEFIGVLVINYITENIIKNYILYMIIQFIIEIILIYSVIMIINLYIPPIKMKTKKICFGSFVSTCLVYIILILFLKVINIIFTLSLRINIISIISIFFIFIYCINYALIIGIYVNYILQKQPI